MPCTNLSYVNTHTERISMYPVSYVTALYQLTLCQHTYRTYLYVPCQLRDCPVPTYPMSTHIQNVSLCTLSVCRISSGVPMGLSCSTFPSPRNFKILTKLS